MLQRRLQYFAFCAIAVVCANIADQTCSVGDETCNAVASTECRDENEQCSLWAGHGEVTILAGLSELQECIKVTNFSLSLPLPLSVSSLYSAMRIRDTC